MTDAILAVLTWYAISTLLFGLALLTPGSLNLDATRITWWQLFAAVVLWPVTLFFSLRKLWRMMK